MVMPALEGVCYLLAQPRSPLTVHLVHRTTGGAAGPTTRVTTLAALKSAVSGNSPKTVVLAGMFMSSLLSF